MCIIGWSKDWLWIKIYDENGNYKDIIIPQSFKNEIDDYIENNNPVKSFIDEYLIITNNKKDKLKVDELKKIFVSNYNEIKTTSFIEQLIFNKLEVKRSNSIQTLYGVKLKEQQEIIENRFINDLDM